MHRPMHLIVAGLSLSCLLAAGVWWAKRHLCPPPPLPADIPRLDPVLSERIEAVSAAFNSFRVDDDLKFGYCYCHL